MGGPGEGRDHYDGRVQHQQPPATTAGPHVQVVRVVVMNPVRSVLWLLLVMVMMIAVGKR